MLREWYLVRPPDRIGAVRQDTVKSAALLRQARLRAGLNQIELASRSGKDRVQIGRWEAGHVAPSLDTLLELVRACGFDLPLSLVPLEPVAEERLTELQRLSPRAGLTGCSTSSPRNPSCEHARGLWV